MQLRPSTVPHITSLPASSALAAATSGLGKTVIGVHAGVHHVATRAQRAAHIANGRLRGRPIPNGTDLNIAVIREAGEKLAVGVELLPGGFLKLTHDGQVSYTARWCDFAFEPLVPAFVCGDKHLTSTILTEHGLPVPSFGSFGLGEYDNAVSHFRSLAKPVVTKPTRGTYGGAGVTLNIKDTASFRRGFARARAWSSEVMVEAQVAGENLRITVLDQEVLGVVRRVPAHVVGDGASSVRLLIAAKNASWRDGARENRLLRPILVDQDVERVLRTQGLTLRTVPPRGATVYLREVSNADQGGEVHDVAREVHAGYVRLALDAAAALGPTLCGIDLIAEDPAAPPARGRVFINEVNTTPALYVANAMVDGRPSTSAAERILRRVFALDR